MRGFAGTAALGTRLAAARQDRIGAAVIDAIAYADLFDWPLSAAEVHRYLPMAASSPEVAVALEGCARSGEVVRSGALHFLPGRDCLVTRRRERAAASARLWPRAIRACRRLAALPWIRLIAVSGSLAVGAADDDDDVDLFIVTVEGRVWLARALTIAVGRRIAPMTEGRGTWLCPNYIVSTGALALPERDLFTAHELAQLVPLQGEATYRALLTANSWYRDFLPNHPGDARCVGELGGRFTRRAVESVLRNGLVSRAELWERERKIARLTAQRHPPEVRFDAAVCKGHFGQFRQRTLHALSTGTRLEATA